MVLNNYWYAIEVVHAYGHPNVKATHRSTFEITRESFLTERGDCIIAVNADKAVNDFSEEFKNICRNENSIIIILLLVDSNFDVIIARGHRFLKLSSNISIVVRKSEFIDERTLAVCASKAARDLKRDLVIMLRNPNILLKAILIAFAPKKSGPGGI